MSEHSPVLMMKMSDRIADTGDLITYTNGMGRASSANHPGIKN